MSIIGIVASNIRWWKLSIIADISEPFVDINGEDRKRVRCIELYVGILESVFL